MVSIPCGYNKPTDLTITIDPITSVQDDIQVKHLGLGIPPILVVNSKGNQNPQNG